MDVAWEQEDLDKAVSRTVQLLHHHTVPQKAGKTSGKERHDHCLSNPV